MENRADLIYQPRTGTNAEHVMAASQRMDLATVRDVMSRPHPKYYDEMMTIATGICLIAGLDPDEQPEALIEGAVENDEGIAWMEDDELLNVLWKLHMGRKQNEPWHSNRFPTWIFEGHYIEVGNDD